MRKLFNALIICVLALGIGFTVASPAQASDAFLSYCTSTQFIQTVPASRNIGSSTGYDPDGFRSCSWQGRWGIRVTMWPGNSTNCQLNIVQDTGANAGDRTIFSIPKDGVPHYWWNASYPNPNDSQSNWYHLHIHQAFSLFDCTFTQTIIRVG